ncbi:hypothetical protein I656_00379 [Geobacillus sp. WSUCF1]|nr:hypothetical protein I656_00379 [Geobacillus sp. WSUCF1]
MISFYYALFCFDLSIHLPARPAKTDPPPADRSIPSRCTAVHKLTDCFCSAAWRSGLGPRLGKKE